MVQLQSVAFTASLSTKTPSSARCDARPMKCSQESAPERLRPQRSLAFSYLHVLPFDEKFQCCSLLSQNSVLSTCCRIELLLRYQHLSPQCKSLPTRRYLTNASTIHDQSSHAKLTRARVSRSELSHEAPNGFPPVATHKSQQQARAGAVFQHSTWSSPTYPSCSLHPPWSSRGRCPRQQRTRQPKPTAAVPAPIFL